MTAWRHKQHRYARLISIKPELLAEPENVPGAAPDLETYGKQKDPTGDFFTEADLLKLMKIEFPHAANGDKEMKRRGRIRAKQQEALTFLENRFCRNKRWGG